MKEERKSKKQSKPSPYITIDLNVDLFPPLLNKELHILN